MGQMAWKNMRYSEIKAKSGFFFLTAICYYAQLAMTEAGICT